MKHHDDKIININEDRDGTVINVNVFNGPQKTPKNKWVALALLLFLGIFGAHKFYEGKTGMGLLYIFTGGLLCIGVVFDFFTLLCQPTTYYV